MFEIIASLERNVGGAKNILFCMGFAVTVPTSRSSVRSVLAEMGFAPAYDLPINSEYRSGIYTDGGFYISDKIYECFKPAQKYLQIDLRTSGGLTEIKFRRAEGFVTISDVKAEIYSEILHNCGLALNDFYEKVLNKIAPFIRQSRTLESAAYPRSVTNLQYGQQHKQSFPVAPFPPGTILDLIYSSGLTTKDLKTVCWSSADRLPRKLNESNSFPISSTEFKKTAKSISSAQGSVAQGSVWSGAGFGGSTVNLAGASYVGTLAPTMARDFSYQSVVMPLRSLVPGTFTPGSVHPMSTVVSSVKHR